MDDLYARLEVPADATHEAIEIAWRALLKRHHPDVAGAAALDTARRINVAHDWLSDPALRDRYDRERGIASGRRGAAPADAPTFARPPARRPRPPQSAVPRFVERVGRLTPVDLARLSVADTTSIAFVASIRRFLTPAQSEALERVERELRARVPPADWAVPAIHDAILAAGHELVLAPFLDEHLAEPFRSRARDRLMRGWEAAIDQPRYGPGTPALEAFVARAAALDEVELRALVRAAGRDPLGPDPWPRGLDPDEDETLRVSSVLAARDAERAAAEPIAALDPRAKARALRLLRRTAHVLVLRHAFAPHELDRLLEPWRTATSGAAAARPVTRPEPRVTRR